MRVTINRINDTLRAEKISGELVRGKGYFYFVGDDFDFCYSTSVYTCHLTTFALDWWIARAREFKAEHVEKSAGKADVVAFADRQHSTG